MSRSWYFQTMIEIETEYDGPLFPHYGPSSKVETIYLEDAVRVHTKERMLKVVLWDLSQHVSRDQILSMVEKLKLK